MLNNIARQNPPGLNPAITELASKIIDALITKVNNPKVKMLIGKVIKSRIGRKKIFNTAKNAASQNADQPLAISTPGIK